MNRITAFSLAATAAALALAPLAASAAPADDMTAQERIEKRAQNFTKRFDKLDANHDGVVTREEAQAPMIKVFDRLDANHDGVLDEAEIKAAGDKMEKRMARRGGGEGREGKGVDRLMRSDGDKDGKITRDEFLAKGAPWFERADADKDGKVTKDELAAMTEKMQKRAERAGAKSAE